MACENDQKDIDALFSNRVMPEEARNIQTYLSQDGKMKARLTAPFMLRLQSDTVSVEFPNSLHVDFFDDSTHIESKVDSRYGIYYENFGKVYLRDSVLVTSVKGDSLWCHDLWWDQNQKIFYTDTTAIYKAPGKYITGTRGLEATQDFSTVTFKYPRGSVQGSQDGPLP